MKQRQFVSLWEVGKINVIVQNSPAYRSAVVVQLDYTECEIDVGMCECFGTKFGSVKNIFSGGKNKPPVLVRCYFLNQLD